MRNLTAKTSFSDYGLMFISILDGIRRVAVAVINTCDFSIEPGQIPGSYQFYYDQSPMMIEKLSGVIIFGETLEEATVVLLDVEIQATKFTKEFYTMAADFVLKMAEAYSPIPDDSKVLKLKPSYETGNFTWIPVAENLNPVVQKVFVLAKDQKLFALVARYKDNPDQGYHQNKPLKIGDISYAANSAISFVVGKPWEDFEVAVYFKWCEDLHFGKVKEE